MKAAVGMQPVLPLGTPCPVNTPPYRVVIEGDGEALTMAKGAGGPGNALACGPLATRLNDRWMVAACASNEPRKGCLWMYQDSGVYWDRSGTLWRLRAENGPSPDDAGRVKGRFSVTAESGNPPQSKALSIDIDVGADVTLSKLPPNYWGPSGGFPD
jgi:hypothetical protein